MRKTFLFALLSLITLSANSQNPFVQTWYTSDPAPLVHGDRLYVYTGHDEDIAGRYILLPQRVRILYQPVDTVGVAVGDCHCGR